MIAVFLRRGVYVKGATKGLPRGDLRML